MRKQRYGERLKKWEIALALALTVTLACPGGVTAYWWGTIFPGFAEPGYVLTQTAERGGERVQVRLWLLDWAREKLGIRNWEPGAAVMSGRFFPRHSPPRFPCGDVAFSSCVGYNQNSDFCIFDDIRKERRHGETH